MGFKKIECINTLEGHTGSVNSVSFSPDNTRIVSASSDKTIKVWNSYTGECIHTLIGHTDYIFSSFFSPDGSRIVSGSYNGMVRIWNSETYELISSVFYSSYIGHISFSNIVGSYI